MHAANDALHPPFLQRLREHARIEAAPGHLTAQTGQEYERGAERRGILPARTGRLVGRFGLAARERGRLQEDARGHRVHADGRPGKLQGQAPRERFDPELRRAVRGLAWEALCARTRRDVDDRAAAALQHRQEVARQKHRGFQIDSQGAVPVLPVERLHGLPFEHAGVVHDRAEVVGPVAHPPHHPPPPFLRRQVGHADLRPPPVGTNPAGRPLQLIGHLRRQPHPRPGRGQRRRDPAPQPPPRPGHQHIGPVERLCRKTTLT